MSVNLIELAKGMLTKELVGKASSFLGESGDATQSGIDHILPSLIGSMVSKAGSADGANALYNAVSKPEFGGGMLDNLGDLFGGGDATNNAMDLGGSAMNMLMGNKSGGLIDLVSSAAGLKSGSTSGLIKMLLPLVMSMIGKRVAGKGVGALLDLLGGQKDHLAKGANAGFMEKALGALGLGSLGSLFGGIGNVASGFAKGVGDTGKAAVGAAGDAGKKVVGAAGDAAKGVGGAAVDTAKSGGNLLRRILPFALLALAALLILRFLGCDNKATDLAGDVVDKTKDGVTAVADGVGDAADAVVGVAGDIYNVGADAVGSAIEGFENLGKIISRKIGDGVELFIPENGIENNLLNFIDSKDAVSDDKAEGWINFDRVLFETGSANLSSESQAQIANISAIMNAYPDVAMKIGGYTDNVGDPGANVKLSQARAEAVVAAIVANGIDAGRLSAEGYGEAHPVASNDTDEGRQQNRRVAARITAK